MRVSIVAAISLFVFASALSAQEPFTPAQLQIGGVPQLPVLAVGGGEVLLEVSVGIDGDVTDVKPLRTTPPFTEMLMQSVRAWRFSPALEASRPVASKVLVAGLFRPPALAGPTLGEAPKQVAPPSDDIAVPLTMETPDFPSEALRGGVVLLEARVDGRGSPSDIDVLVSAEPFDDEAGGALSDWTFRPARTHGPAASSLVYVVMGFAAPVSMGAGGTQY